MTTWKQSKEIEPVSIKSFIADNDFNLTGLGDLTSREQDIFIAICTLFSEKRELEITVSVEDLRKITQMNFSERGISSSKFRSYVDAVNNKLGNIKFHCHNDNRHTVGTLFITFDTADDYSDVRIELHPRFKSYFFNIEDGYTWFILGRFLKVRSKYSKALFRLLYQYINTGEFYRNFDDFRELLEIPPKTTNGQVMRIVNKAKEEIKLTGAFDKLEYKLTTLPGRGHQITKITFYFHESQEAEAERHGQRSLFEKSKTIENVTTTKMEPNFQTGIPTVIKETKTIVKDEKCPRCGGDILIKTVKYGINKGKKYKACINHVKVNGEWKCPYWGGFLDEPKEQEPKEQENTSNSSSNEPFPKE